MSGGVQGGANQDDLLVHAVDEFRVIARNYQALLDAGSEERALHAELGPATLVVLGVDDERACRRDTMWSMLAFVLGIRRS
ncbi:hypothetical protein CAE01nite_20600 [Cellulomonas aerilata]|uniref:Uncharacterized protein n=1 Tax=Cellulomonas aerilata TaxID=515326 RepID=A0A512DCZ0_9CELL|nr:hypothetical protein CAE01nite_20600 [Cellulomonas aerilata]